MGMLVGVIFYFVLKGGLLAVLPADAGGGAAARIATTDLNQFTLAGLGTMVGLFSKNALEKLRELFNTVFVTQSDFVEDLKRRLPADQWKEIRQYFVSEGKEPDDDDGGSEEKPPEQPPPPPANPPAGGG
jgi:hypothetical protein